MEPHKISLYDTIFYKPEDDPKGLKHVALLIIACHCVVYDGQ